MGQVATVYSQGGSVDLLGQIRTYLAAAKVRLFQAEFSPAPGSVLADFVAAEANFTGYAPVVLGAWSPVALGADGLAIAISTRAFFQATDAVAPNNIGGAWLETTGGVLEFYWKLLVPTPINVALAYLALTVFLQLPGQGYAEFES